jgi:penicillin amidase
MRRRWRLVLLATLALAAVFAVAFAAWGYRQLQASLPVVEGTRQLPGLASRVAVARDALGIPTIRGASREDVARATGFVHAQDRFFQMDLSRRRAAGELAALVGARALVLDVDIRLHRFRPEAEQALSLMQPRDRAILDAYTDGVNDGLASLGAPPFEYLVLRQEPQPWRPEDCLLVVLSMFITLQDTDGAYEAALATMHDVLPPQMFEFMVSRGTEWDAPVVGEPYAVPAIPGPDIYNPRARRAGKRGIDLPPPRNDRVELHGGGEALGSNNWAVSGRLTADGGALLANDMHLSVRVPNVWYRAVLEWPDGGDESAVHRLIGVTLPGFPALVAGSNTHIAWGFTNTYADWSDIVVLEVDDAADAKRYRTPHGWREFEQHQEVIEVAGQQPRRETVRWTMWGPVLGPDHRGRLRAYRWVAHSAERLGASATPLETARSVPEAFDAANGVGAPGQNIVVVDRDGRIGWSVFGSIPRRVGVDPGVPASWADGARGWQGWLSPHEYPRLIDPPDGRIWTANARVVDGDMLATLGDGSYEVGSRATIIRDRLMAKTRFTPADMLDIQLDTSARFLARWRDLILQTLTPGRIAGDPRRARFRELVEKSWTGRASPDAAGSGLTRRFREQVSERVMGFVLAECYEADGSFDHTTLRRREGPVWKLVAERPMHLLDAQYGSWDELLVAAVDAVIDRAEQDGDLERTWSDYNVTAYRHPLSAAIPFGDRWLDMPVAAVPGDLFTPRVHWGAIAASERMVVSPGREEDGIMHMPTGQSGHPLSPFYSNSHEAWVKGEKSGFLPGPEMYRLVLTP